MDRAAATVRVVGVVQGMEPPGCPRTPPLTGQLILGTDQRNPLFTIYVEEEEEGERLHVYYGLELLEKVSADREDSSFKMLVGRLDNAKLNRRVLGETFQVDPKTMRSIPEEARVTPGERWCFCASLGCGPGGGAIPGKGSGVFCKLHSFVFLQSIGGRVSG